MHRFVTAVLLVLTVSALPALAQASWQNQLAVTGGAQFPTETFGDGWKTGSGFSGTYYSRPSSYFFFGLRSGYHRFQAETSDATLNLIPVHFASKLNLSLTGLQPYLGLDGGLYLLRPEQGENSSEFGVAPKFGFRIPLASGVDLDLNTTYEVLLDDPDNRPYWGVNAGFAYIFGR